MLLGGPGQDVPDGGPGTTSSSRADGDRLVGRTQNGLWLTAPLGLDRASTRRSVARTVEIALAP